MYDELFSLLHNRRDNKSTLDNEAHCYYYMNGTELPHCKSGPVTYFHIHEPLCTV